MNLSTKFIKKTLEGVKKYQAIVNLLKKKDANESDRNGRYGHFTGNFWV
jgi:hypothetical protein